jgi:hypothetical protein
VSAPPVLWALLLAISPNERIDLQLVGGQEISGRVASVRSDGVDVATEEGRSFVPTTLVEEARFDDRTLNQTGLQAEIGDRITYELGRLPTKGPVPNPYLVATSSLLVPGMGEAFLGDWSSAKGLFIADLLVLGLGSYLWFVQDDRPAAVPLFGLDLIFRLTSSSQVYRKSRRLRSLSRESEILKSTNSY